MKIPHSIILRFTKYTFSDFETLYNLLPCSWANMESRKKEWEWEKQKFWKGKDRKEGETHPLPLF